MFADKGITLEDYLKVRDWWVSTGLGVEPLSGYEQGFIRLSISLDETSRLNLISKLHGSQTSEAMRKETGYKHERAIAPLREKFDLHEGDSLDQIYLLDTPKNRLAIEQLVDENFVDFTVRFSSGKSNQTQYGVVTIAWIDLVLSS